MLFCCCFLLCDNQRVAPQHNKSRLRCCLCIRILLCLIRLLILSKISAKPQNLYLRESAYRPRHHQHATPSSIYDELLRELKRTRKNELTNGNKGGVAGGWGRGWGGVSHHDLSRRRGGVYPRCAQHIRLKSTLVSKALQALLDFLVDNFFLLGLSLLTNLFRPFSSIHE